MNKILITGGAGFIGFHLAKKLSENNYLTIIDNFARGKSDKEFKKLTEKNNVKFIDADITDSRTYISLQKDFDYIYHLAAVIGVKNVHENPDKVLYVNAISTLLIFEFAKSIPNLKNIFFSSTSEIYAGTLKHFSINIPTDEKVKLTIHDIESPRTTYMLSKMYGESICFNYGKKYNIPFTIGRYHNVYGPRMGFLHVVPEMFIKINKNKIIECPSPNHTRALCYIDDAVEATIRACEYENTNSEILNIGNQSQEISIKKLVLLIAKIMEKEIAVKELPDTPGSPERRCPDISKIIKLTGYSPEIQLDKGIEKTFNYYKDKLNQRYE